MSVVESFIVFTEEYPAIKVETIRNFRGICLTVLRKAPHKIPTYSGVYVWRYWPSFNNLTKKDIIQKVEEIKNKFPILTERLKNNRLDITVDRKPFTKESFLVPGASKNDEILKLLDDEDFRLNFANTMEIVMFNAPPLYIGKAKNLRSRLEDHFDEKTPVINLIRKSKIPEHEIFISFIKDTISYENNDVTSTIEEILQRLTNPPLTKRYG